MKGTGLRDPLDFSRAYHANPVHEASDFVDACRRAIAAAEEEDRHFKVDCPDEPVTTFRDYADQCRQALTIYHQAMRDARAEAVRRLMDAGLPQHAEALESEDWSLLEF